MVKAAGIRAKIKRSTGKYTVEKITLEVGVGFEERAQVFDVVSVEARGPCGKSTCVVNSISGKGP